MIETYGGDMRKEVTEVKFILKTGQTVLIEDGFSTDAVAKIKSGGAILTIKMVSEDDI